MAIDSSQIEGQIDANLPDNSTRQNKAGVVRALLKIVIRWVRDAVNNTQTVWLRSSDNQPGGSNADEMYRTGNTRFLGGLVAKMRTTTSGAMKTIPMINALGGAQVEGNNGGPAWIDFHRPGVIISKLGLDTDNVFKVHPGDSGDTNALVVDNLTAKFALLAELSNRKLSLYGPAPNDHQFYGFGINPSALRYQVEQENASHVFFSGLTPATSRELARITGKGLLGIGGLTPAYALDVATSNADGQIAQYNSLANAKGAFIRIHQAGVAVWRYGQPVGVDAFVIQGWGNGTDFPERFRIDINGNIAIGNPLANARLHVKHPSGATQLILDTPFTPAGTGDGNGSKGAIAWDDNYFYVKTAAGWKRAGLSTF